MAKFTFEVVRNVGFPDVTIGELRSGKQRCSTLEDEERLVKVKGETRIPPGTYRCVLKVKSRFMSGKYDYRKRFGPKHYGMVHITGVPGFRYILIHCGNNDDQTDGCILVGESTHYSYATKSATVGDSRGAYRRVIMPIIAKLKAGTEVWVTVRDQD